MDLAQYHQWWKHQGGQELRRLLMEHWDPIGVKDASGATDEYDGYRGPLVQLLRDGASAEQIADYLSDAEARMGLQTAAEQLRPVGNQIVRWYAHSLARWEASHPTS